MSTLKVAAINNPSASSGGLAISTAGNVTGAGLDLITTQSFSAASSVSVNNCFTSTYLNYRFFFNVSSSAGSGELYVRLRAAGADNTTSNYRSGGIYSVFSTGTVNTTNYNSATAWTVYYLVNGIGHAKAVEVMAPQDTVPTAMGSIGANTDANAYYSGWFNASTSFDGFTIYPYSGTITGTLSVYGYRK